LPEKADPAAVRPAFAIVARRVSGLYDLMLLIDPNAPEERRSAVISETESMLTTDGEIVTNDDWGTRRMAYEIDHRPDADYRLYQFQGENPLLERLNQRLRIMDGVLRFRIIKVKPGQPTPPPPDQQAPRRREDREAQDTKVAARAAADAPPADDELAGLSADDAVDPGPPTIPASEADAGDPAAPATDAAAPDPDAADAPAADAEAAPPAEDE
jgi:small subunit ribosomal protein S6